MLYSAPLTELIGEITASLDKKLCTMGVFIDLKKSFDTVDHRLLCKKNEFYGIRGVALNWITSYLANRSQFVSIDGSHSSQSHVSRGVPQGSVLGPKLFVNDLCNVSNLVKCILFADDTSLFWSDSNVNRLFERVSSVLASLCRWFATNKLSLNVLKTSYMLFRNKAKKEANIIPLFKKRFNKQVGKL